MTKYVFMYYNIGLVNYNKFNQFGKKLIVINFKPLYNLNF